MKSNWDWIFVLLSATIFTFGCASEEIYQNERSETNELNKPIDYRLPLTIIPTSYDLMLALPVDENTNTFDGTIKINVYVAEPTNEITFHAGNITITSTKVVEAINKLIVIQTTKYDPITEKYTLVLGSEISEKKNLTIAVKYRGTLRDDMIGFYRSSYIDKNGEIKWLAATQFQATHARHAFPCFDEPSFKSIFTIRILRLKKIQCLSNMPLVESKETTNELVWDTFSDSVIMSTYLVAFVVSDFSHLVDTERNFTVWARPNAIEQAAYALKIGPQSLELLSKRFMMDYQLEKMDMVALPDFAAGAMENWGLITFRETRMLYDENDSSVSSQQDVAAVIVHECVHMWFGNLVTPMWWDYLWLSEAFARYYQYMAVAELQPDWKMEQQFVVEQLQSVFGVDALESSSPMTKNVSSQAEIGTTGDTITYAKGASIVRMMELTFGSNVFNSALQEYLKKNQYSAARPENLWSALQNQVNQKGLKLDQSVETIMNTWTRQPGFPVLSVKITKGTVSFHQERFFLRNSETSTTKTTWWIPITWTTGKDPNFVSTHPKYWLGNESSEIRIRDDSDQWIIFNIQQAGYYRVNYDKTSWYQIIKVLMSDRFKDIHEVNRAALVDDLLNLARAGLLDYDTALTGVDYIKRETNYLPFKAALAGLEYLHKRFSGQANYDYIKNHSLGIVEYIYDDLGYDDRKDDDRFTILLRKEVNEWACRLDHQGCIEKSLYYFNNWRINNKPIPKNFRTAAYCAGVRNGNLSDWNFLWDRYLKSNSASEKLVILKSLGCSEKREIVESLLLKAVMKLENSGIRKQDSTTVFSAVYGSGLFGAEYILDFVEKHHSVMAEYYGGYDTIASILSGASQRFSTDELIKKFEAFIKDHSVDFKTIEKSLNKSLEVAKYELNWYVKNENDIITWMKKNNKGEVETTTPEIITTTENPSIDGNSTSPYRLPTNIVPKSYVIKVTPYIESGRFTFDGSVEITVKVTEATNEIVLHINEIVVHSITLSIEGKHVKIASREEIEKYHFMVINVNETLTVGTNVIIEITYTGELNKAMKGFYRSSYIDDAGKIRWLAATHLEPVGARKMFPCFDEPALKSTFVVSVSVPKGYNAISNTPIESSVADVNGRVWITFEKTPVMSTYLVALIVSDFESLDDKKNNCSTWARPNAVQQSEYALSVMTPLVKYFETALKHPYQLTKLDMAALPDFSSGAMENWGLLTYKESNMLYDPDYSPITSKQAIANVISHEISHQWLGNQVSPRWWKYLWLSESFARYFQYHGTANVEKEWGLESQFVVEQVHSAFSADALTSSHPMSHDVYSPSEISGIFDTISYAKGASVLRMVEKTFGSLIFYEALHDYLEARKYNDATPEHLFEAFEGQINLTGTKLETTFKTIMDTWTTQAGYPVVNVKITGGVASLVQNRFFLTNPDDGTNENIWWIPITWTSKSNPKFTSTTPQYWLSKKNGTVNLDSTDEWTIFNVQETGYYRVNYDLLSWNRIISALKSNNFITIHEVNRASIIDDLLILGQAGQVDYEIVLSATQYLSKETNYIPWRAAFNGLVYLNRKFDGKSIYELYKTHILTILKPIYEKLGLKEESTESHYDKILRRYVVEWACKFGVESCISSSLKYFAEFKTDSSKLVPVNLRNSVYCTAIKYGSTDDWNFLWEQYSSANVTTEKVVILSALGCSNNTELLDKLLTNAITENSPIRLQDSTSAFSAVYSSGLFGAEYTLDFVERKYMDMYNYYGSNSSMVSILSGVSSRLSTKELVLKFEKFVKTHETNLELINLCLEEYVTRAHQELIWYDTNSPRIFEWLDKTYPSEDYRLPTKIYPNSYDIYLTPHFDKSNFTFDGKITIDMNVYKNTSSIVLQANELSIKNIIVYIDSVNPLEVSSYTINSTTHRFTIYLKSIVPAGSKLRAYITYSGLINDKMKGFSRSSYIDENGKIRWLASTKFEPVHARLAFPCFDEPSFKAKFTIHIERPDEYQTLSNMPRSVSIPSTTPNRTWDSYEESVRMSSYLVAFVISDFASLKNEAGNFSVWARPEVSKHGAYSLHVGQEVLRFLENFTAIDYPINKMDFVAIPDFASGAMENWGLITFREYGLLQHENVTSATYKKYLTTVVAHELVHMWFGNLVTCDWWDYIWLNEGFAQYFQWIASDHTEPGWNLLQQFVVYELQVAMETDASPNIHPMNNKVTKPLDIINSFDKIAYGKSASVIRMMHHALGPKVFEPGLRTYLEKNKYKTAKPSDLWSSIQIHEDLGNSLGDLNVTIEGLMDSWTNTPGYPVVNATWSLGQLILTQERFLLTQPEVPLNHSNPNFFIPIKITTKTQSNFKDTSPDFWFSEVRSNTSLILTGDEWFVINIQQTGYYRVNYDEDSWKRLGNGLGAENFDGIHEINRAQIIDDLLNLARIDYVNYDIALWTTKYLKKEENHLPWKAFFNAVNFLNQRFDGHEIGQEFAEYVLVLTQQIYEKIGFDDQPNEDHLQQLNRQLILSWACKLGHSGCLETACQYFDQWRANEEKWISPNARPAVYCASIKEGTHDRWEFLWQQYEKSEFSSEKIVILNALGCSRNTTTLRDYLKLAISSDNAIRDQDVATAFSSVYNADRFGVDVMLDFLLDNYKDLRAYYGSWSNVAGLFSNVATRFSTEKQIEKLELFVNGSAEELSEISSSLKSSLDTARKNFKWFETHKPIIHLWLNKAEEVTENNKNTTEPSSGVIIIASIGLVIAILVLFFA